MSNLRIDIPGLNEVLEDKKGFAQIGCRKIEVVCCHKCNPFAKSVSSIPQIHSRIKEWPYLPPQEWPYLPPMFHFGELPKV